LVTGKGTDSAWHTSDDSLLVSSSVDPLRLWHAHQARVAADGSTIRNPSISDSIGFLVVRAQRHSDHVVAMGYKTRVGTGELRGTFGGGLKIAAKVLSPSSILRSLRERKFVEDNGR
jgi:hypothetical protein